METSLSELIEQDLRNGASMLSRRDPNWEMLKRPEPIFYVLARHAVSKKNDWIAGARLVEDLLPLKRADAKTFNPDGWLGKEYTDIRAGNHAKSAASERWIPHLERSHRQPYEYRLSPDLYDLVERYDFSDDDSPEPRRWLFQANPEYWDVEVEVPKIGVGGEDTWTVSRHGNELRPGDSVAIWKSGSRAGVYGFAEITGPLTTRPLAQWRRKSTDDDAPENVVPLRYTHYLTEPVLRTELSKHPLLSQMGVIRAPQGTNFRLSSEEWHALRELLAMDKWDGFIYWAKRLKEWPGFDAAERDYKLSLAQRLGAARGLYRAQDDGWVGALRGALTSKDNNFTNWRTHSPFIDWMEEAPQGARSAVSHLWDTLVPPEEAVETFAAEVQLPAKTGKSGVITLASVLLGAVDMMTHPPYRKGSYFKGYDLTGYSHPPDDANHGGLYAHSLRFLDRILSEAASRGLVLRDRLDGQSVLWSISQGNEVEEWSEVEKARFRAFVNGTPQPPVEEEEKVRGDN